MEPIRLLTAMTATVSKQTGTAGTPTVRTQTDLTIRHLEVASIQSRGSRCDK